MGLLKTLDFGTDADTDKMRYDPISKHVYVGHGRGPRGALAIVDPSGMERLQEFKLGSHPESFQLERDGPRIFVNLPDQEAIGVIDQKSGAVTKWTRQIIACSRLRCNLDDLLWWIASRARW